MLNNFHNKGNNMPNYIIAYRGQAKPASSDEGMAHMGKWKAWVSGLGDAIINAVTSLKGATIITSDGISNQPNPNAMGGYMIIKADDMQAALKITQSDPHLDMIGGALEVAEIIEMG